MLISSQILVDSLVLGIDVIGAVSLEDGANCVEQLLLFCGDADVCRKRKVSVTRGGDSSVPTVKGIERARAVIRTKDGQLKPSKMTHQAQATSSKPAASGKEGNHDGFRWRRSLLVRRSRSDLFSETALCTHTNISTIVYLPEVRL